MTMEVMGREPEKFFLFYTVNGNYHFQFTGIMHSLPVSKIILVSLPRDNLRFI